MNGQTTSFENMGVDHGGGDIFVAEEFLNGTDIIATLKQVGSETVAQGVGADRFMDTGLTGRLSDGFTQATFIQVMPADLTGARVNREMVRRKHVLPAPLAVGVEIFAFQSIGQVNSAMAAGQVFLMQGFNALEVLLEGLLEGIGQNCHPVFIAFTGPDDDLMLFKVNIFDAQA
jgi:hypothetical protein